MLLIKSVIPGQTDSRVPLPEHGCCASVESWPARGSLFSFFFFFFVQTQWCFISLTPISSPPRPHHLCSSPGWSCPSNIKINPKNICPLQNAAVVLILLIREQHALIWKMWTLLTITVLDYPESIWWGFGQVLFFFFKSIDTKIYL